MSILNDFSGVLETLERQAKVFDAAEKQARLVEQVISNPVLRELERVSRMFAFANTQAAAISHELTGQLTPATEAVRDVLMGYDHAIDAARVADGLYNLAELGIGRVAREVEAQNETIRQLAEPISIVPPPSGLRCPDPTIFPQPDSELEEDPVPETRHQAGFHGGRDLPEVLNGDWDPGKIGF